jgi:hypothetical protein
LKKPRIDIGWGLSRRMRLGGLKRKREKRRRAKRKTI